MRMGFVILRSYSEEGPRYILRCSHVTRMNESCPTYARVVQGGEDS